MVAGSGDDAVTLVTETVSWSSCVLPEPQESVTAGPEQRSKVSVWNPSMLYPSALVGLLRMKKFRSLKVPLDSLRTHKLRFERLKLDVAGPPPGIPVRVKLNPRRSARLVVKAVPEPMRLLSTVAKPFPLANPPDAVKLMFRRDA